MNIEHLAFKPIKGTCDCKIPLLYSALNSHCRRCCKEIEYNSQSKIK